MGGFGSGRWERPHKKATVENSLTLAVQDFHSFAGSGEWGTLRWRLSGGRTFSLGYGWESELSLLAISYTSGSGRTVCSAIPLQSTPLHFGGCRWWFTCPMRTSGAVCGRRVGKLYLAAGSPYFACRQCHNLTYKSSQQAHKKERWKACYSHTN